MKANMLVNKPFIIMDRIHLFLLQVAWFDLYGNIHYWRLQMPIEKVNVYVGCSCRIMGTNSFGMHTINLLHEIISIIWLGCCMLQIIILLLHSYK